MTENLWLGKMIFKNFVLSHTITMSSPFKKLVLSLVFETAFSFLFQPTSFI